MESLKENSPILSLDIGNSTIDACLIKGKELQHIGRFYHPEYEKLRGLGDRAVAVSVSKTGLEKVKRLFGRNLRLIDKEDIPISSDYRTPDTLGTDRLLIACGVRELYSRSAVLVSVGTALVVDLMIEGVFKGGFITLGPFHKLKALSERAEGVPDMELRKCDYEVGMSTQECVLGGVYLESRRLIETTAKRWSESSGKELPIYITGGDGWLFEDLGTYDPLLIHRAIQRIIIKR